MSTALEIIRNKQISVPIILAGNKVDLERKRAVLTQGNIIKKKIFFLKVNERVDIQYRFLNNKNLSANKKKNKKKFFNYV